MRDENYKELLRQEIAYCKETKGSHGGFTKDALEWEKGFLAGLRHAAGVYRAYRKMLRDGK
jgi:hypothetical protein